MAAEGIHNPCGSSVHWCFVACSTGSRRQPWRTGRPKATASMQVPVAEKPTALITVDSLYRSQRSRSGGIGMKLKHCMTIALVLGTTTCLHAQWKVQAVEAGDDRKVVLTNGTETKLIYKVPGKSRTPTIDRLATNLVEVLFSCGSPCSYSTYARTDTGQIDGPYFLKIYFDPKAEAVFYVGDGNRLARKVLFTENKPQYYELPDVSPTAVLSLAIKDISARPDGTVVVRYLAGKDYSEKEVRLN